MRELKFRVFAKELGILLSPEELSNLEVYLTADGKFVVDDYDPIHLEHYDLLQYTGLKDKNGREIYEGDILKYSLHYYEVKFLNGSFIIECSSVLHLCALGYGLVNEVTEIAGNIYEHPELLSTSTNKDD